MRNLEISLDSDLSIPRSLEKILDGVKRMLCFSSFISAITLIGTPREVYVSGTQYLVFTLAMPFVMWTAASCYMPVFYELQVSTSYEVRCPEVLLGKNPQKVKIPSTLGHEPVQAGPGLETLVRLGQADFGLLRLTRQRVNITITSYFRTLTYSTA